MTEMIEKRLDSIIRELTTYVSEDVNWVEACTIYIERHNIDPETFAVVIKNSPFLMSKVIDSAKKSRTAKFDYAILPI